MEKLEVTTAASHYLEYHYKSIQNYYCLLLNIAKPPTKLLNFVGGVEGVTVVMFARANSVFPLTVTLNWDTEMLFGWTLRRTH